MENSLTGKNFIADQLSALGTETYRAYDPAKDHEIDSDFTIGTITEVEQACKAAQAAFGTYKNVSGSKRAEFLRAIAEELEARSAIAIERAHLETALPIPRLTGELGRTTGQLRMFASMIEEGSWVDAHIEHGDAARSPVPKPDLRKMLCPIGPVAIFGASNFPFAFSVAGGDTASALAAGCPVIVKAHPAHPGASEIAATAIVAAIKRTGMPNGVFSMVHGSAEVGQHLIKQMELQAIAFTGSFAGGMAIAKAAAARQRPIPAFVEMGSTNPVAVLEDAIDTEQDCESLAKGYIGSLTLGAGQFCTNPGLILGYGPKFAALCRAIANGLSQANPEAVMLTPAIAQRYRYLVGEMGNNLGVKVETDPQSSSGSKVTGMFFTVHSQDFLRGHHLSEEVFGPSGIGVQCDSLEEMLQVFSTLPGQLTATLRSKATDADLCSKVLSDLSQIAGRVIFNGFPTGVEVNSAMQHGGPFPATLDSKYTSVGTGAIFRFVRPIAYQDLSESLLPDALKETNPLGIKRFVDGKNV